ncbi:MAG TPA: transglutaminase-like domain-containing protein [Phycisphaerae bacterium]|nr:transglutaminase-like domain-containing protein [Phycisphaerae bacterium]
MWRHPFDELMELDSEDIRLDCAALHLARDVYPDLDIPRWLGVLDEMADAVAERRPGLASPQRYAALREVLVEQYELSGNPQEYYAPDNSYLNRVLEERRGIPVSLALVWVEVGRRLKWPVAGVGLPGHFLVRVDDPERFIVADPFNDGRSLSLDDCRELVQERFGRKAAFSAAMLEPVATRPFLGRLLGNLRSIYLTDQEWSRLEQVLQRLLALEPENSQHVHDLAAVRWRQGDLVSAYRHLAVYLDHAPGSKRDQSVLKASLRQLQAAIAGLN